MKVKIRGELVKQNPFCVLLHTRAHTRIQVCGTGPSTELSTEEQDNNENCELYCTYTYTYTCIYVLCPTNKCLPNIYV